MTNEQFNEWRLKRGWSKARVARELQINQRTVTAYETHRRVPRYIALAIAALEFDLPPYR